jgi:hypothetical protein
MGTIKEARFILNGDPPFQEFDQENVAEVKMENGSLQRPSWKSLRKYWRDAESDLIEWACIDAHEELVLFSLAVAEGQGGVIAIWDTGRSQWKHVSSASFIYCAMIVWEIEAILTFHYVFHWGVAARHEVSVRKFDKTLDWTADRSATVSVRQSQSNPPDSGSPRPIPFSPSGADAMQSSYRRKSTSGNFVEDEFGPVGLFRLRDEQHFVAHDHGNRYDFTMDDVIDALTSDRT